MQRKEGTCGIAYKMYYREGSIGLESTEKFPAGEK